MKGGGDLQDERGPITLNPGGHRRVPIEHLCSDIDPVQVYVLLHDFHGGVWGQFIHTRYSTYQDPSPLSSPRALAATALY